MVKKLGSLFASGLGLFLLIYSASRSLHFIGMTLPPDRKILAWFGLAALDGGLLAWLLTYLHGSVGGWQRAISLVMVIIDLLGSILLFSADTLLSAGNVGLIAVLSETDIRNVILALSGIIAANIAAVIFHELTNPENLRRQAEEEARSLIQDQALEQIKKNAGILASQVAPQIAADWKAQTEAEFTNKLRRKLPVLPEKLPEETVNPTSRRKSKD